jgi:glycerol-3-phosphate dehydrogenase
MANTVIVAAGPWTDFLRYKDSPRPKPRLRTTKGVHVVCRGNLGPSAFLLQNKKDRRIFFIIPFMGNLLIGTTDTDYMDSPDQVKVETKDIDYLLSQTQEYFPGLNLAKEDIITTFAGLRPLVYERGSPSKVSRKHVIERHLSGVYYVMGGKYTTCRTMAHECLTRALPAFARKLPDEEGYRVYGSKPSLDGPASTMSPDIKSLARQHGIDGKTITYLIDLYGSRFEDVLKLVQNDPTLKMRICSCSPAIRAQVVYAVSTEMARNPDDVYLRRLGLGYQACSGHQCRQTIAEMMSPS